MEAVGAWFPAEFTVTDTAAEVVVPPPLSVTRALSEYVPAGTFDHVKPYGLVVSLPISVVPW
jgi:hypothetical protein